jgi:CBS domain-containing protein
MTLSDFICRNEKRIDVYASTKSVEALLLQKHYLAAFRGSEFYGILTLSDYIQHHHNLVIDCISEKPFVNIDQTIDDAVAIMLDSKVRVIPVFDKQSYCGSVSLEDIIHNFVELFRIESVSLVNYTGSEQLEQAKTAFISDLCHNTRNPVQKILSAASILAEEELSDSNKILIDNIVNNVLFIDQLFNRLLSLYF